MNAPPSVKEDTERELTHKDLLGLQCLDQARRDIVSKHEANPKAVQVSHSETYGYIFRYPITRIVNDKGDTSAEVRSVLVLWTKDCKSLEIAVYPSFELSVKP